MQLSKVTDSIKNTETKKNYALKIYILNKVGKSKNYPNTQHGLFFLSLCNI